MTQALAVSTLQGGNRRRRLVGRRRPAAAPTPRRTNVAAGRATTNLVLLGVLEMMTGCSQANVRFLALTEQQYTWPPPPAVPRLRYLGEIGGRLDAALPRGFGASLDALFYGPSEPPHLVTPHAVSMDDSGTRLAVADTTIGCVHVLDLVKNEYHRIDRLSGVSGALGSPVGVTWAGDVLYIADASRHTIYAARGDEPALAFGTDELVRPSGIVHHPINGRLYVSDAGAHAIVVFELDGTLVTRFGSRGSAAGLLNFPSHLAVAPDGTIVVADSMNFRVQRFGPDGAPLGMFGRKGDAGGDFALPKGIAVDSNGTIWVVDAQFENVQAFTADGSLALTVGEEGHGPGQFWLPAGIDIDRQHRMWIADTYNRRVQVFELLP